MSPSFIFGGENKTFIFFIMRFKAWVGGIGVQILIFFCVSKGELKKCSFFLLYNIYVYIYICLAGLRMSGSGSGKGIYFQSGNENSSKKKQKKTKALCILACYYCFVSFRGVFFLLSAFFVYYYFSPSVCNYALYLRIHPRYLPPRSTGGL